MHPLRWLVLLPLVLNCAGADLGDGFQFRGAAGPFARKKPVRARLVLSHETARPGQTIQAGVEISMDSGWHTYWQNPGVGEETKIYWAPAEGISAGPIQWPVPEKFITGDEVKLTSFVYHDRVVLLVPLTIASNAAGGLRELSALVKWLQCEKICVPGSNQVSAMLTIGNESRLTDETNFFAQAQKRLPLKQAPGGVSAKWDQPPGATNRAFLIEWAGSADQPDFFPFTNALAKISPDTQVLAAGSNVLLRTTAQRSGVDWPQEVSGLLVRKEGGALAGYETTLKLISPAFATATVTGSGESKPLLVWLAYAFIGGLILNIMPCVLPVIALKILGFVSQSREQPARVRALGLLYTLGVIVSFLLLAGIVIGVKAAGQKAGWGMQFSNPQFIVVLTTVVTLVALNLFGLFEVTLGGGAVTAANQAASRHGSAGAFMNGVLATVLATPCTAPFLGASLGFAFAQPPHIIVLIFATVALGLASPYLLLSWNPRWLKFLPKPGAWMERFKVAMGFPMLATAVWLFTLTGSHYGARLWWLGVFLVVVALAAWVYGEFFQRGTKHRGLAFAVVLLLLGGGYLFAVEQRLRWREPILAGESSDDGTFQDHPGGVVWRRWSPANVAKFRAEGRPIIVDFTAEWCVTCNTVVKPVLESEAVKAKLKEINAVALLADYTKFPPAISAELEKFQRAGVPMVLVYPKDSAREPVVLPEVLTAGMVLKALEDAAR